MVAAGNGCHEWPTMFQKLQFRAKNSLFCARHRPRPCSKRPNEGKWWLCSTCSLTTPSKHSGLAFFVWRRWELVLSLGDPLL